MMSEKSDIFFSMNLLGHIYLSNNNNQMAVANLFGDFVKGKKYLDYPEWIQKGVLLHREIDQFIDNHEKVRELIQVIRPDLPKVASVAIDLFFDHLLAKNWQDFHKAPLTAFLAEFYGVVPEYQNAFNADFNYFLRMLLERKWINHYSKFEGLQRMCHGVGKRISFPNALPQAYLTFSKHETTIESVFYEYMRDANEHFLGTNSK